MGRILVGTASWTDKTLLESGWYPDDVTSAQERLAYYASCFPVVEVDSSYYAPPPESTVSLWRDRTPAGFTFDIKAFSLLTQHPTKPAALPKDLRDRLGDTKKNLYLRDLDPQAVEQVWDRFLTALAPLHDSGRLGAILFQFPRWFPIGKRNKQYILECKARCDPLRISVEFRNHTWMTKENQAETLDFLTSYGLPYVSVDMPQGYPDSIPPVLAATADLAVVRFHGHSAKWTSHDVHERFGYLYSEEELGEWAPRLRRLAEDADTTHILMNNCYRDNAQVNARQLARLIPRDDAEAELPLRIIRRRGPVSPMGPLESARSWSPGSGGRGECLGEVAVNVEISLSAGEAKDAGGLAPQRDQADRAAVVSHLVAQA